MNCEKTDQRRPRNQDFGFSGTLNPDAETADAFLDHVIEEFKNQRMCSPPSTANMTITTAGSLTTDKFRELWNQRAVNDSILNAFMSMMVLANSLHIHGREAAEQLAAPDAP
jgi:Ulp1 family protease